MTALEQVAPGIWRLALPLERAQTNMVNTYAVTVGNGLILIDSGWDTPDTLARLTSSLDQIGAGAGDVREVLITHAHADHYGAAGRLGQLGAGPVRLHSGDVELARIYSDTDELARTVRMWSGRHGLPAAEQEPLVNSVVGIAGRMASVSDRRQLRDGELIPTDQGDLEVIATPGHTDGHVVLFLRSLGLLFSGDHVLPSIFPNVSSHAFTAPDPLGSYLASIRSLPAASVLQVLPGHGEPFDDLPTRVAEILEYHEMRLAEVGTILGPDPISAYDIASRCRWAGGRFAWSELPPQQRRHALFATLARAERLVATGAAEEVELSGSVQYRAIPG